MARRKERELPDWESRRTATLIRRYPSIFAYHCPEAAHHLIPDFNGQDLRALVPEYRTRVVTRNEHVRLLGLPPEVRIPTQPGHPFRRNLGTDSGHLGTDSGHLGTDSGHLGASADGPRP